MEEDLHAGGLFGGELGGEEVGAVFGGAFGVVEAVVAGVVGVMGELVDGGFLGEDEVLARGLFEGFGRWG